MRPVLILVATFLSWPLDAAIGAQSPDVVQTARTTLERLAAGRYADIVATFDDKMRAALPEDRLRATWASVQTQIGELRRAGEPAVESKGSFQVVVFPAEFATATAEFQLVFDRAGRIAGFSVRPPRPATPFADASYVARARFAEREITVDADGWPLPGTLAVPDGQRRHPAVVLVHGSGPVDRDGTVGPNRAFRDLAHGLASRGVAVLRFEKRTREHGRRIAQLERFTVKEEAVDDAVAAVRLLQATPEIDPGRIYVLGHSLGGMLAPQIGRAPRQGVAGTVPRSVLPRTG